MNTSEPQLQYITVHGHRRAFVRAGSGPVLLLLHGLGCDHTTWAPVIRQLAKRYTVIAPDLLGHGSSAKPRADYSLGGHANGMRDLLALLEIDTVTVVGHSFGGGVANQFAYQYPERVERLILVASGGLGPEVTPAIRALTAPGMDQVLGLLTRPGVRHLATAGLRALSRSGLPHTRDLDEIAAIVESFKDGPTRAAVRHIARAVVDWRGQVVTMLDRAYLTEAVPLCVIWGRDDTVIPVRHANNAAALAPGVRVQILPKSGHFPHKDHPERFVKVVTDFIASTEPATYDPEHLRDLLVSGSHRQPRQARAGQPPLAPLRHLA